MIGEFSLRFLLIPQVSFRISCKYLSGKLGDGESWAVSQMLFYIRILFKKKKQGSLFFYFANLKITYVHWKKFRKHRKYIKNYKSPDSTIQYLGTFPNIILRTFTCISQNSLKINVLILTFNFT